jgi:anti-anti-sigma regulatory factor
MTAEPSSRAPQGRLLVLPIRDGTRLVVVLAGEADLSTEDLLRAQLVGSLHSRLRSLVIDATDLTFCDLRGLDALRDAVRVAECAGVAVTIRPSAQLARLTAAVRGVPETSGRSGPDPLDRPLPGTSPRPARALRCQPD